MFEVPKLVVLILVFGAVWLAYRWIGQAGGRLPRRRGPQPQRTIPAQDLVACGVCGSYVAADASACARPDCPQPR